MLGAQRKVWLNLALVAAAALVAHGPALQGGFIWDDNAHVTPIPLRSWDGLVRIWGELGATQQYYPVLHSAFWLQHQAWGDAPFGYHVVNVALHALAAVLFAVVLRRLTLRGGWVAALLFAVHPVQVESVAWISEQKNTLSAVFYLGAALAYLRFDRVRAPGPYLLATGLFALGLATKTVVATLPAGLLVVLWWQRGALDWRRDVLPLVPWLAMGAAAGLFTAEIERGLIGADGPDYKLSVVERLLLAGRAIGFYAGKLLWPAGLVFVYPRWSFEVSSVSNWIPPLAAVAVLVALWRLRHRSRGPVAAALIFVGTLFPALGFVDVYPFRYSFVADHFQYLATLPLYALGGAGLAAAASVSAEARRGARAAATAALVALGAVAWRHTADFRDNRTLFATTVARNPAAWMAWNNLAKESMTAAPGSPRAIGYLEKALALRPDYFEARNNLGLALTQSGRSAEAIPHLEAALQLNPASFHAHNNLGIALASSGRPESALGEFAAAAALNPRLPSIHENWAKALRMLGREQEADERFAVAARLRRHGGLEAR